MNNYRLYCDKLQIDFKKNILALILKIALVGICSLLLILFVNYQIGIFSLLIIIPIFLFHIFQLEKKYHHLIASKEIAFFGFYRNLINLLENKVIIYNALKETIDFVDETIKNDVLKLIENIENDSSIQPFIEFSNQFENIQIKQMILILYQSQENSKNAQLLENMGNTLFQIQDEAINEYVEKEVKSLEKFYLFPLILSALAIVLFSVFIFQSIGVNGLV